MSEIVTFNYEQWICRYPEFNGIVTEPMAQAYFIEATIYHRNDGTGPVRDKDQQLLLLDMLTAHIAKLYNGSNGAPVGIPGRISNASEGSVSVGFEIGDLPQAATWFAQTTYGLSYWTATMIYRTARYIPGPRPYFGRPLYAGGWPRRFY